MAYQDKLLSRLMTPGFALVVLGMLAVLLADVFTRGLPDETRKKRSVLIKGLGTAVVAVGAILIFTVTP